MSYDFRIGNAVPAFDRDDFPYLSARWVVEPEEHAEAPCFENDSTEHSNLRSPSYRVWADFARTVGLYDWFYDERGHLHAGHPGCVGLTVEDADRVTRALQIYRAKATLPAGFEPDWNHQGPPRFDYHLARLIWLEYWVRWAVEHCETPAIQNT